MRQADAVDRLPRVGSADLDEAYAVPLGDGVHVRANMVASVDGAAVVSGGSEGLSGAADRRVLSVLRGLADVILVGAGTVADVLVVSGQRVEPAAALAALEERGLRRVLCEGGPSLLARLSAADRLDELCLTISPTLVAGSGTRVLAGTDPVGPRRVQLRHVLQQDGFLLLRYAVG